MPHDVFLSYASHDRAAADAVCAALERRGIECWMAPRDVRAGEDWGEAILTAIGRAHAMVLILSRHTAASAHVRNEVVTAVSQSLALVPVRIEDCQPGGALRLHLAGSHWLAGYPPPIEQHADAMAAGVRLALAADATIELPPGQAAAMVAAARAASARMAPPGRVAAAAAPRRLPQALPVPPGRPVAQVVRPGAAPVPARAGLRRRGRAMLLAGLAVLLLAGLCTAAWFYEPKLYYDLFGERQQAGEDAPAPPGAGGRLAGLGRPGHAARIRAPFGEGRPSGIGAIRPGGGAGDRREAALRAGLEPRPEGSGPLGAAVPC